MSKSAVLMLVLICLAGVATPASARESSNDAELRELRERERQNPGRVRQFLRDVAKLMEQENIAVRRDVVYSEQKRVPRERRLLDLYLAGDAGSRVDTQQKKPIVLYVHGGAWVRGGKAQALFKPVAFVPAGFVFASTNYRFRPEASVAEMAASVAEAAAWLMRNAEDFGGDPERLFLIGHSAGAHLVSVLGTNTEFLEGAGVDMNHVRGVVSLDTAVYDLPKLLANGGGRVHKLVFDGDPDALKRVSPWHHVAAGSGIPPFLVFYAEGRPAAQTQTIPFVSKLQNVGHDAAVHEAVGRNHGTLDNRIGTQGDEVTSLILEFFDAELRE